MTSDPHRVQAHAEDNDGTDSDHSDGSSSAPNSEDCFIEDDAPADIELVQLEDDDYTAPIPVIVRLCPPVSPRGPPILEVWGARPFGYLGERVIWTTFRAEPESDDVDDDASFWEPLGIRMNHDEYHRAFLARPNAAHGTLDHPPPNPPREYPIFYSDPERRVVMGPNALLVKTFSWSPEDPELEANAPIVSTFWLFGCGKVTDRKDQKRIRMKIDVYISVVKRRIRRYIYPPGTEPTAST